jgi:hypothetical protein
MWWRRAALTLNGMVAISDQNSGRPSALSGQRHQPADPCNNAFTSLAQAAMLAHHAHLRWDHLRLERRCQLLRLREPEPEVGQASLFIALAAGNLHLRRQTRLQFRNQLHSPNHLRHQLTLVP